MPVEFIGFRQSQYEKDLELEGSMSRQKLVANLPAQSLAMASGQENENPNWRFLGNSPNLILFAHRLTPKTMGALIVLYEAKIVFQGFCWNIIKLFDQEGVQLGKVLASQVFTFMQKGQEVDGGDPSAEMALIRVSRMTVK